MAASGRRHAATRAPAVNSSTGPYRAARRDVADAAASLARLIRLLEVIHDQAATSEQIVEAFDENFGDDSPLRGIVDPESSARTVLHRLLDDLADAGYSITTSVDHSSPHFRQRYRANGTLEMRPHVSDSEQRALDAVAAVAQAMIAGGVWMLIDDDRRGAAHGSVDRDLFTLADAVRQRSVVTFNFSVGRPRELHPYVVALGPNGRWFVGGWCTSTESIRTFPVDAIRNVGTVQDAAFRAHKTGELEQAATTNPIGWDVEEPVECELEFADTATPELFEELDLDPATATTGRPVKLSTGHPEWLLSAVTAHWPHVRIVGPPSLLDRLIDRLTELAGD